MKYKGLMAPGSEELRWLGRCGLWLVATSLLFLMAEGCGSSSGGDNPPPPTAVIGFDSFLVDVGQRFELNASSSLDNAGVPIDDEGAATVNFQWTVIPPAGTVEFDERCQDVPEEICTANDDDHCRDDVDIFPCATNADCPGSDICLINSGTTSADCTEGICLLGSANRFELASFVAQTAGPYDVRLLAETGTSNSIAVGEVDTYPSLYVLGSLFQFGGTLGGMIGELADGETFAPGAVRGIGSPQTGNFLLADPSLGVVREFDVVTGSIIGSFGETSIVDTPVALAFDASGRLFVADVSGQVFIFDGASGLAQGTFADVTTGAEAVASILFAPSGELLVVDGRGGEALRVFSSSGVDQGALGQTGAAVGAATDAAFLPGVTDTLLIADGTGDLVACDAQGNACASFGTIAALLAGGIPRAVDVNPAGSVSAAEVLVADFAGGGRVIGCNGDGSTCTVFGDTAGLSSSYNDIFFSPPAVPTTTSTSTTSTTTTTTMPLS